jgi:beta-lactamase class D
MLKLFFGILLNLLLIFPSYAIDFKENKSLRKHFDVEKVTGTFVLFDVQQQTLVGYNKNRAETLYTPASTFKIFNALIGLEHGAVKNVDDILFKYTGQTDLFLDSWKQNTSLRSGMKVSHVPAFQALARKIGMERMQTSLNQLNYGNKKLGNKVDEFWLESDTLKISPIQQTELIAKLATQALPLSKKSQTDVKEILLLDTINGWNLYGKTGWATRGYKPSIGWFVGWIERDDKIYSFALNIDIEDKSYLAKRIPLTKKVLEAYGLLK